MNIGVISSRLRSPFLVFVLFAVVSCAGGLCEPNRGVTNRFFKKSDGEYISIDKYDFSRLEQGYGLFIFSYELKAQRGNNLIGWSDDTRRGIRVWEYKFLDDDWEIKKYKKRMFFWGFRSLTTLFLFKAGYKYSMMAEFHKGRIVYGGRLVIEQNQYFKSGPGLEFHFEEDMAAWLDQNSDKLSNIKIDTVLLQAGY